MNVFRNRARAASLAAALVALTLLAAPALVRANAVSRGTPNLNFLALLHSVEDGPNHGFGLVWFRQPKDADKIVYLDVWVWGLAPNHGYSLQRATDSTVNDDCTGTNWLTLGQGLVPKEIATDRWGIGRADLFRDLAAVPLGMQFDIQFRVIDTVTSAVVLESACHQFTVGQ